MFNLALYSTARINNIFPALKGEFSHLVEDVVTASIHPRLNRGILGAFNKVLGLRTGVDTKRALLKELLFWENTVSKNPTYIDGWIELAKTASRLEDLDYAEGALNSAKSIDPNSEKIREAEYYLKN